MYTSSDSAQPNRVERNVFISSTNIVIDNPSKWNSWAANIFWSTSNPPLTNNVPAAATIADPMLNSLSPDALQFQSGSPAIILGISPITLFELHMGVGPTLRLPIPPSDLRFIPSP